MHFGGWTLLVWKFKGPGLLINNRSKIFIVSFILVLIIGGSIEFLQSQMGRSMDWQDEVANFMGALIAWRFWLKFENKWPIYQW